MTTGMVSHNQEDILYSFCTFYRDLYQIKVTYQFNQLRDFLDRKIPSISNNDCKCLNTPITLAESPNGKALSIDGLLPEIYKIYGDILLLKLLKVFNLTAFKFPDSMNNDSIIVLCNPGKDYLLLETYHPISLLNSDVKILARVLATRLKEF